MPKQLDPSIPFDRTPTCDRRTEGGHGTTANAKLAQPRAGEKVGYSIESTGQSVTVVTCRSGSGGLAKV